ARGSAVAHHRISGSFSRTDVASGGDLPARRHRRPVRKACAVTEPLLQIEGLTKRFGGVIASDAITLDIPRGEFHAIIGPNGAGKTTLIGLLAGEITPHSGTIHFDGGDITPLP